MKTHAFQLLKHWFAFVARKHTNWTLLLLPFQTNYPPFVCFAALLFQESYAKQLSIFWTTSGHSLRRHGNIHIIHVKQVLMQLQKAGAILKAKKRRFLTKTNDRIAHELKSRRLEKAPRNTGARKQIKELRNSTKLRSFSGECSVFNDSLRAMRV